MWLDVGGRYPNQNRLTVVVWGKNWSRFNILELDAQHWLARNPGEERHVSICIMGKVVEYKGVPQIELQHPGQIRIALH